MAAIPITISTAENVLTRMVLGDNCSPIEPLQSRVMAVLYRMTNSDLVPMRAITNDAGPSDKARSKIRSATFAVMNSLTPTNTSAGLLFAKKPFTSFKDTARRVNIRNTAPNPIILTPWVYSTGRSSSTYFPTTFDAPNARAENIRK